jgi:hypothetical protein
MPVGEPALDVLKLSIYTRPKTRACRLKSADFH